MGKSRPPKVHRYSMYFKATAVRLSELSDVLIRDVAEALDIHPFMLSRWRKQAREGLIVTKGIKLDDETVAELKRLRDLEKKYKVLQQEHELLKKAIRFASDQKRKSSDSSKQTGKTVIKGVYHRNSFQRVQKLEAKQKPPLLIRWFNSAIIRKR